MLTLLHNIRFYILLSSFLLLISILLFVLLSYPSQTLQIIRINQLTSFASLLYLYLALLPTPLYSALPSLPYKTQVTKARRALGVSSFIFGLIHASIAFFGQLDGFVGIPFLTSRYLLALFLGFLTLQILCILALTSFDKIIAKITFPKWKRLHRLIYLAGVTVLVHTLMLGTHYTDLSQTVPQITFFLLATLLLLEAVRVDKFIKKKYQTFHTPGVTFGFTLGVIMLFYIVSLFPNQPYSLGLHSLHLQIAKEAQQTSLQRNNPALSGDRSKRYTVGIITEKTLSPHIPTTLQFTINDASNGFPTLLYSRMYEKLMHLIIVDESLEYFDHIHPEQKNNNFVITTSFPSSGEYHLYTDFQPLGAIEQQMAFTLTVDEATKKTPSTTTKLSDTVGDYHISLQNTSFKAKDLSLGKTKIIFKINDKSGKPVTSLRPYLASFGHLVMINTKTYDYIHVHPFNLSPIDPASMGGPVIEFLPLGLYGPIKPGIYRLFAQFNPDNQLITADFTIHVQ